MLRGVRSSDGSPRLLGVEVVGEDEAQERREKRLRVRRLPGEDATGDHEANAVDYRRLDEGWLCEGLWVQGRGVAQEGVISLSSNAGGQWTLRPEGSRARRRADGQGRARRQRAPRWRGGPPPPVRLNPRGEPPAPSARRNRRAKRVTGEWMPLQHRQTKCRGPGRRGWDGPIGARGQLRLRVGHGGRESTSEAWTASVAALAPPGWECRDGLCRRRPGKDDDDNLLKQVRSNCLREVLRCGEDLVALGVPDDLAAEVALPAGRASEWDRWSCCWEPICAPPGRRRLTPFKKLAPRAACFSGYRQETAARPAQSEKDRRYIPSPPRICCEGGSTGFVGPASR